MKVPKNYTIDEDLLPMIEKQAIKEDRSESFIVNQILVDYYRKNSEILKKGVKRI